MFGTRNLCSKAQEIKKLEIEQESVAQKFLLRLYQQGKQISQIIAYIWRWADENDYAYEAQKIVANKLKSYFVGLEQNAPIGNSIKLLFGANPDDPSSTEGQLLRAVFYVNNAKPEGYIFPMFDEFELSISDPGHGYLFEVTPNDFSGALMDPQANAPEFMKFIIPYPPRPVLGNATLDKETLEEWIKNIDSNEFFAANPYIPTTCC
ncbi:MAG: hypothetical protein F6J86_35820 [Symploca sp. SIO1B1]|nr:hypothetical protein [Symploca sp. SIO1B1]